MKTVKIFKSVIVKAISLAFVCSMLSVHIFAQPYYPLLDSNKFWNTDITIHYGTEYYGYTTISYLNGDTVINNQLYYKVYSEYLNDSTSDSTIYIAAMREDTAIKKLFFMADNDTVEKLRYDFSLNIGDTVHYYATGVTTIGVVQSINYIEIDSTCRRMLVLDLGDPCFDSWIEGIGSTSGLMYPGNCFYNIGAKYFLGTVIYNGDTIYNLSNTTQCNPNNVTKYERSKKNKNMFYPNPFTDKTTVSINKNICMDCKIELTLYNILGEKQNILYQSNNSEIKLERGNLKNGIYFYKISSENNFIGAGKIIVN